MKKAILTILSFLVFFISKSQVTEFLSLQSAVSPKDSKGNFVQVKEWLGQEIHISFNLSQKKVQFFSKGMLDRDTFSLKKEILIVSRDIVNDKMIKEFSGIDRSGKKCLVKLKLITDEYKMQDGELRVEYLDGEEIYKIRTLRFNPIFKKVKFKKCSYNGLR